MGSGVDFMVLVSRCLWRALAPAACITLCAGPVGAQEAPSTAASSRPIVTAMLDDAAFGRVSISGIVPRDAAPRAGPDLTHLKQAIEAYRTGDVAEGDRLRTAMEDPTARAL